MRYATETTVSVEKSKAEIERLVIRYGAEGYSTSWRNDFARIEFIMNGRHIRLDLALPDKTDERFRLTKKNRERTEESAYRMWERECRSMWRALKMIIHAKLEAVEIGLSTYDREFMADIMLPDGKTVGDAVLPKIDMAYKSGAVGFLLPEYGGE